MLIEALPGWRYKTEIEHNFTIMFAIESGMRALDFQMQHQMRLFRAQRNFYIVGFTLFLCLVIRRLLALILANAEIQVRLRKLVHHYNGVVERDLRHHCHLQAGGG